MPAPGRDRVLCEMIRVQYNFTTGELTLCVATTRPVKELEIRVSPANVNALRHALMRLEESLAAEDAPEVMVN